MSQDKSFFVSRTELLAWLNDLLALDYKKVEDCASGAVHCQIMDSLFPGKVPMSKVNFGAKVEYEFVNNYKILQKVFDRCNVDKPIEVSKLVKAKYQDNLEFLQWMKGFHDRNYSGGEYDGPGRRAASKGAGGKARPASAKAPTSAASSGTAAVSEKAERVPLSRRTNAGRAGSSRQPPAKAAVAAAVAEAEAKVSELTEENMELKLAVDGLERERDFYFGKLRDIEIMCQTEETEQSREDFVAQVTKILYATEDDFVSPEDLEKENGDELDAQGAEDAAGVVDAY